MNEAIAKINARFPLTKRDAGEYTHFKAAPLTVDLVRYTAEGLGNVSLLTGKAMAGLMRMDTLVINPFARDVPLFSYDFISAMEKKTMLVEYYDTLLDADAFNASPLLAAKLALAALPDHDLGAHWYDGIKLPVSFAKRTGKKDLPALNAAFLTALDAYLSLAADKPALAEAEQIKKRGKAAAYVDGLLTHGGPSTDAFVKAIGAERTRNLFAGIVFGTEAD